MHLSRQSLCSFPLSIIFLAYIVLSVLIAGVWPVKQFLRQGEDTTNCHSTMLADTDATVGHRSIPRVQNIQETSRKDDTHTHRNGKAWKKGARSALAMERERHLLAKDVADLDGRTPLSLAEKGLLNHLNGCGMQPCARFLAEFSDFFNGRERT